MDATQSAPLPYWRQQIENALLAPVRAMRLDLPAAADGVFRLRRDGPRRPSPRPSGSRRTLTWTPAELAALASGSRCRGPSRWCSASWSTPCRCFGSQRRAYVFIGAGLIAARFILLAGAAGGWITVLPPGSDLSSSPSLLTVIGVVLQDVVADAMSTEVVPRDNPDGSPRPKAGDRPRSRHGAGAGPAVAVVRASSRWPASRAGWRQYLPYSTVFLIGLIVPAHLGLRRPAGARSRRASSGRSTGASWAAASPSAPSWSCLALSGLPFSQEIMFVVSMAVVIWMLRA